MVEAGLRQLLSRRGVLARVGQLALGAGILLPALGARAAPISAPRDRAREAEAGGSAHLGHQPTHSANGVVGTVDGRRQGFTPMELLTQWDYGTTRSLPDGRTLREFRIVAIDREIEIAPGVRFNAWTYNGRVPGPALRCIEGELIRVHFSNAGTHAHTMHFHGFHGPEMDGVPGIGPGEIPPGGQFTYEFEARPFGCHLYHCHAGPLKRHIHKGLYGMFVIDPDPARHTGRAQELARRRNHREPECQSFNEMIMVMNAFDTDFDGENEVYAVNTVAFGYVEEPIPVRRDQPQRVYLANLTEFDPINSLHLHGNFFDYYEQGTTLEPTLRTVDTIMQCQAQRGILEFSFAELPPGRYMFHAHQSEFAELGWMGFFEVS